MDALEPTLIWNDGTVGFVFDIGAPTQLNRPDIAPGFIYGYVYSATLFLKDQGKIDTDEVSRRLKGKLVFGIPIKGVEMFMKTTQTHGGSIGVVFEERLPKTFEITL